MTACSLNLNQGNIMDLVAYLITAHPKKGIGKNPDLMKALNEFSYNVNLGFVEKELYEADNPFMGKKFEDIKASAAEHIRNCGSCHPIYEKSIEKFARSSLSRGMDNADKSSTDYQELLKEFKMISDSRFFLGILQ